MGPAKPKMICAWCKKVVRKGVEPASHGICTPCRVALLRRRPGRLTTFNGVEQAS